MQEEETELSSLSKLRGGGICGQPELMIHFLTPKVATASDFICVNRLWLAPIPTTVGLAVAPDCSTW